MEGAIKSALLRRGTTYRDIPGPLVAQLEMIAGQHNLDAQELAGAFDKFMTTSRSESTSVSAEDVEAFAEHYERASRPTLGAARPGNLFAKASWDDAAFGLMAGSTKQQPASQRISPYLSKAPGGSAAKRPRTPASSGKFRERAHRGQVVSVLNPHVEAPAQRMEVEGAATCAVEVLGEPLAANAKYMMNRIEDKVERLERRINALEDAVEAAGLDVHSVARAAQEEAIFVGRICCDAEEGKLNEQSVLLEGSVRHSQGSRVRLDLSKCPAFRLFPGQVVAVRGVNPSGHCIVPATVTAGLALPMQRSSLQQLAEYAGATDKQGLSVVVAAGPFSSSEDVEFEPLGALLQYAGQHKPDVLLLVGPFLDADHPAVRGGMLDETFDDIFETRVLDQLAAFSAGDGSGTQVLVMPSVKDVHHHPVFPQQPFSLQQRGTLSLANPATVRCNEVVFGAASPDWLMAVGKQELSRAAGAVDRLPALASHLLAQRNYMPMFPPPPGLPLDSAAGAALDLPASPDILVLPSDLQPFAKLVPLPSTTMAAGAGGSGGEAGGSSAQGAAGPSSGSSGADSAGGNVVCINPGRLAKGASGGTFAHVYIPPLKEALEVVAGEPLATNDKVPHRVDARCRVEIRRV